MNKTYKEKLQRQFLKSTLIPLVISFVIFSALLAAYIFSYTRLNLNRWSELAEQKVRDIYTYGAAISPMRRRCAPCGSLWRGTSASVK